MSQGKKNLAEEAAQINLLTSNLHELSDKIKVTKFDELQSLLKLAIDDREGLEKQLNVAIATQKSLQSQVNEQKVREQMLLKKIEGFNEQLKEQEAKAQKVAAAKQQKDETIKQLEERLDKVRSNLDFYNSKNKANAKLISEMFSKDEAIVKIVTKQIEPSIKIFDEREPTIENELAKLSVYMEEFVKMIIYRSSKDENAQRKMEKSVKNSQVIRKSKEEQIKEDLLSQFTDNNNIKDGLPQSFKLGSIKQIEEHILYIKDKLEGTMKVQAVEKLEELKAKYANLKKEKADTDSKIAVLNGKLEAKEKELNTKVYLLIGNIHSLQEFMGKKVDTEALLHDSTIFTRFDFEKKFKEEMEELQRYFDERVSHETDGMIAQHHLEMAALQVKAKKMADVLYNAGYDLEGILAQEYPEIAAYQNNQNGQYDGQEENQQFYMNQNTDQYEQQGLPENSEQQYQVQVTYQDDNQYGNVSPNHSFAQQQVNQSQAIMQPKPSMSKSKLLNVSQGLQVSMNPINKSILHKGVSKVYAKETISKELYEKQEKEKADMEEAIRDANRKIKELRKQNLELIDTIQKKEMFSNVGQQHLTKGLGLHMLDDLRKEVRAKEKIIENVVRVNNELTDRLSVLQAEKILVLNNKKACEDLFVYFNQKATEIFLMNEKTNQIIAENRRLRRFIEQMFHELSLSEKDVATVLKNSGIDFNSVLEQTQQTLMIANSDQNFDPRNFKLLYHKNEFGDTSAKNKEEPVDVKNSMMGGFSPVPADDRSNRLTANFEDTQSQYNKSIMQRENVSKAVNYMNAAQKQNLEPDFLAKFNAVLMENYELRGALEVKEKIMADIGKDLMQYKRKVRMVANIEQKVERLVAQNMRIKSFMLEIHAAAVGKVNESEMKVQELSNSVEISSQLLDTFIENGKKLLLNKKNAEKKAFLLQTQVNNLSIALEKLKKDSSSEISDLKISIKERDAELEIMKEFKFKSERLEADVKRQANDIEKLNSEIDAYRQTMDLLEKNIEILSRANNTDMDKLREEIDQHRNKLNLQIDERGNILSVKLSLEAEVQKLKEQILDQTKNIKSREEQLIEVRLKLDQAHRDKSTLQDQYRDKELAYERLHIEKDALETEKKSLENDLKIVRERLQEFIDKNATFLSHERENITTQAHGLVSEKISKLETQLFEAQRQLGEQAYALEKRDRELEDQRAKLMSKNKQLIQFNKYFSAMASSKNPNKVEISRVLNQNKELLKEIESLRYKYGQLQALYDNLQKAIEKQSGSPITEFKNVDGQLSLAKSIAEGYIEDYSARVKVDAIIKLYDEKIALKETEIAQLRSQLLLAENAAKKAEETSHEYRMQNDELLTENEGLKQQINAMNIEIKTYKHLISELKSRNQILNDQNDGLQELSKVHQSSLGLRTSKANTEPISVIRDETPRISKVEVQKSIKPEEAQKSTRTLEAVKSNRLEEIMKISNLDEQSRRSKLQEILRGSRAEDKSRIAKTEEPPRQQKIEDSVAASMINQPIGLGKLEESVITRREVSNTDHKDHSMSERFLFDEQ